SETLFLALLFPALLLAERTVDRPTPRRAVAVGLLCGALALVRTLGVVLLPVVLALLIRKRARLAALLVVASALVALLPWQVWIAAHPLVLPPELHGKYGSYGPWLLAGYEQQGAGFVVRVLGRNVRDVFSMLRLLFAPSLPEAARILAAAVVLGIAAMGLGRLARRAPATVGFVTLYMAVVLVWPFSPVRFVWGIWSLFAIVLAAGVVVVVAWHPPARGARLARRLLLASAALVALGHTVYNIRGYRRAWWESIPRDVARDAAPLVRWVLERTRPGDVLATDHETLLYLYSGRQAVPLEDFSAAEYVAERTPAQQLSALTGILSAYNVSYVLAPRAATVQAALLLTRTTPPRLDVVGALPAGGAVFAPPGR
ncbi:MAG: hypothetical protein HY705_04480, partial [Gemmatimonadetes bacterium]|nr:hypothetical protein [Gemmatimonadota bacterium]